jgi:hypothetical protein
MTVWRIAPLIAVSSYSKSKMCDWQVPTNFDGSDTKYCVFNRRAVKK